MHEWCLGSSDDGRKAHAMMAIDENGKCVAYGVLRPIAGNDWGLTPLYGESEVVAVCLLQQLLCKYGQREQLLWMPTMADRPYIRRACHALGLEIVSAEHRCCTNMAHDVMMSLKIKSVHALHEYFPI
jgi:hypothetical protein